VFVQCFEMFWTISFMIENKKKEKEKKNRKLVYLDFNLTWNESLVLKHYMFKPL